MKNYRRMGRLQTFLRYENGSKTLHIIFLEEIAAFYFSHGLPSVIVLFLLL